MRENISIQVGKCGIKFGHEFWKQIASEHSVDPNCQKIYSKLAIKNEDIQNFFNETLSGFWTPRTILFDLDPREVRNLKNGNYSKFYPDDSIINTSDGSGNNWSNGYIRALEINSKIEETFRKKSEQCDSVGSFSLFHSISGGTGSGSSCVMLELIKEHFPGKIINCYSFIANQNGHSDIVVQPYNSVLSMRWLYYYADCITLFENESLSKIIQNGNKTSRINYNHLNSIAAKIVSTFTQPMRSQSYSETNLEGILSSLIPAPNFHFLFAGVANYKILGEKKFSIDNFPKNIRQILGNKTVGSSWKSGRLISSVYFLKNKGLVDINSMFLKKIYQNSEINYINWAPTSFQDVNSGFSKSSQNNYCVDACFFNHTGIKEIFIKMGNQFDILKKRNAFVNSFLKEFSQRDGREIFDESRESLEKLIIAYNNP